MGEDRLWELLAFLQAFRQLDAADFAVLLIAFPARAGDVAADDAFDRDHIELLCLHGAAFKFRSLEEFRHIFGVDGDHMIRHDVFREIEPELGHAVQHAAFFRDRAFQDVVKSRNAVCADHDEAVAQIIQFTNFAGFKWFVFFHWYSPFGTSYR